MVCLGFLEEVERLRGGVREVDSVDTRGALLKGQEIRSRGRGVGFGGWWNDERECVWWQDARSTFLEKFVTTKIRVDQRFR